mgnify:FL=1
MILAELNVWHSRPAVPTRRVALGEDQLGFDPSPGPGGLLLAAVFAAHTQQFGDDENNDLDDLLNLVEVGARIPQPRLRHRLQEDRVGLTRSTHRLVEFPDGRISLDLAPSDRPEPHVLAALYRISQQQRQMRRSLLTLLRSARGWRGQDHDDLLRYLSGKSPVNKWGGDVGNDHVAWALEVLGLTGTSMEDIPEPRQIRRTFRRLLRNAHPDHGGLAEDAGQRIETLTAARNILLDKRSA